MENSKEQTDLRQEILDLIRDFKKTVPKSRSLGEEAIDFCGELEEMVIGDGEESKPLKEISQMEKENESLEETNGRLSEENQEMEQKLENMERQSSAIKGALEQIINHTPDILLRGKLEKLIWFFENYDIPKETWDIIDKI